MSQCCGNPAFLASVICSTCRKHLQRTCDFFELSFRRSLDLRGVVVPPILLHAPEYASLAEFWNAHELGPSCKSPKAGAVVREMLQMILGGRTNCDGKANPNMSATTS